jgi:hypothetical protein
MPQETQLQIDDGTYLATLQLQCATCADSPYLVRGAKTITTTAMVDVSEYPYACPTAGCATRVTVRLPHEALK